MGLLYDTAAWERYTVWPSGNSVKYTGSDTYCVSPDITVNYSYRPKAMPIPRLRHRTNCGAIAECSVQT